MRALKICLWVAGLFCLLEAIAMFLPVSAWESIVKDFFGAGSFDFPDAPLFEYMVRVCHAMAATMGVYLIILALNPGKYTVLIPFTGFASVFFGVVCGITGLAIGMYPMWFIGDTLSCLVLGILILVFWQKVKVSGTSEE